MLASRADIIAEQLHRLVQFCSATCPNISPSLTDGWGDATDHIANIVINHADGCDCDQCLGWRTVVRKVWLAAAHEGTAKSG